MTRSRPSRRSHIRGGREGSRDHLEYALRSRVSGEGAGGWRYIQARGVAVAVEGGLDAGEMNELLARGRGGDEVMACELKGQRLGISGVPFFAFNETFVLSGAQAPETIRKAIEQAAGAVSGVACGVDPATGERGCRAIG